MAGGGHDHGSSHEENEAGHDHSEEEEGIVKLSGDALATARIQVEEAGPAKLSMQLRVNGRIAPISSNVAHLASRFAGVIKEVRKDVGEPVAAGDVLAIVESNQNLQKFEVRAFKEGLVTDRHATVGESIKEDEPLFVVMDLSKLWADFTIFQRDVPKVSLGQAIDIYVAGREEPFRSEISFISPVVDETTQSRTGRAVVRNLDRALAPGAFVTGQIAISDFEVSTAVLYDGIQTIEGKTVVFVQVGAGFEKREISLGRSDGKRTEILSGIKPGEKYAASNTFILKAELGKSEAEHEH
jgi:cobalt-zinc-cadmium efflux system membrane fusion protein